MTLEEVIASYKSLIEREKDKLAKVKNAIFQIGTVRLIIVVAAVVRGKCLCRSGNPRVRRSA